MNVNKPNFWSVKYQSLSRSRHDLVSNVLLNFADQKSVLFTFIKLWQHIKFFGAMPVIYVIIELEHITLKLCKKTCMTSNNPAAYNSGHSDELLHLVWCNFDLFCHFFANRKHQNCPLLVQCSNLFVSNWQWTNLSIGQKWPCPDTKQMSGAIF